MTTSLLSRCPLLAALGLLLIQPIAYAAVQPTVAPNAAVRPPNRHAWRCWGRAAP